jgi:hypothetical protein
VVPETAKKHIIILSEIKLWKKIANLRERHEDVELGRALMVFSSVRKIAKSDY